MSNFNTTFFSLFRPTAKLASIYLLGIICSACSGGGTASTSADVVTVSVNKEQVIGYWTPKGGSNESYDFIGSATESPYSGIRTGRIFKNGLISNLFYWDLQLNGTISLTLVDPNCASRPLTACSTVGTRLIDARGSNVQDSTWNVSVDSNGDGIADSSFVDVYHRNEIDIAAKLNGDFFLTRLNNQVFDNPIYGNVNSGQMTIRLDDFFTPVTLKAIAYQTKLNQIRFESNATTPVSVTQQFFIAGSGYQDLTVKEWFENVTLNTSAPNQYILSYEQHKKVQLPDGVLPSAVTFEVGSARLSLTDFETTQIKANVVGLVDQFVTGVSIKPNDVFYVSLELDFTKSNAGNVLKFTSPTDGTVSSILANHPNDPPETKNFTWIQKPDGSVLLSFSGYGDVNLRFIKPILGGYQVVYSKPTFPNGETYRIRDFVADSSPVVNETNLPGRYVFTSSGALPNGTHEYNLTFHQNKTVSGVVGGFWFQDTNGDIVSYECTDIFGRAITDYASCSAALDNTSLVNFAHVRRLHFIQKDGANLQSSYNASVYGTRTFLVFPPSGDPFTSTKFFTAVGSPAESISLTYRWTRIGDENP